MASFAAHTSSCLLLLLIVCVSVASTVDPLQPKSQDDNTPSQPRRIQEQPAQRQLKENNEHPQLHPDSQQELQQQSQLQQQQQKPAAASRKTKRENDEEKAKLTTDDLVHDFLYGSGGYAKVFQLEKKKPSSSSPSKKSTKTRKQSPKSGKRIGNPKSGKVPRTNEVTSVFPTSNQDKVRNGDKKSLPGKTARHGLGIDHHQISNELQPMVDNDNKNNRQSYQHPPHQQQQPHTKQMTPEELIRSYLGNEEYSRLLQLDEGDLTTQGNIQNVAEYERVPNKEYRTGRNDDKKKGIHDKDGEYYDDDDDDEDDDDDDNNMKNVDGTTNDDGRKTGGWGNNADSTPNNNSFETLFGKHFGNQDKTSQTLHSPLLSPSGDGLSRDYGDYGGNYHDTAAVPVGSSGVGVDVDDDVSTTGYISFVDLGSPVQTLQCPTSCVCKETYVDCSGQSFTSVPEGIGPMTTILDLSMNNIMKLTEDCFAHLPHLEQLNIVGNNLTRLPKKLFKYNTLLRQLNLQGNQFEKVPPRAFQNLQYLLELYLDANVIKTVPTNAFKGLFRLQQLNLDGNVLEHIPSEAMRELTGLQALSFAKNQITKVPAYAFQNNTRLIHILLANNIIEEIEDNAFYGLSRLRFLQLERNMIHEMPTSFSHLTSLEELNLERNRLFHLPDKSFQFMEKLTLLGLTFNPIKSIGDKVFSSLPSLTELVLSEVHDLVKFPDLTGTTKLKKLQLDRANIKSLPKDLCRHLPNITSFDVHSNKIGTIPNMSLCVQISNLNMANNELTSLDGQLFTGLSRLQDLTLSNNFIHSIPANAFIGLSALEYLNLAQNQITYIDPEAFVPLKRLTDLNLGENHISHLPTAGLAQLEKLKLFRIKELREFPPKEAFPKVGHFVLAYPYHCCDFIHSRPEIPTQPDFVENLTLIHPDARVVELLKNLHANVSKQQLKLYENMTIDKNHDVIMQILKGDNEFAFPSGEEGEAPYYPDGYDYVIPLVPENESYHPGDDSYEDGMYDQEVVLPPQRMISCRPKPGPFMPCDDLFGWWSLRCGVWIVFLLALLGNFVVFFVSVTSRSKMDVPRFLICNLALADFFMGIYLGMLAIVDASTLGQFKKYAIQWQMSPGCLVAGFLGVFSSELSVFTLTVITLERFYAITHAMQLNKRLSLKHSSVIMLCGWIFCFGIAVMPLFGVSDYRKFAICLPFEIEDLFSKGYVCFIMTFNGIAFFIILSCYLIMYISIRDSQAWNSNETRVAKRMALLVFTDFMCWAPVAFLSLAAAFGKHLIHLNEAKVLTIFILPLNSCANPFLYAFFTKQFKKDCVLFCRRLEDSSIARHFSQVSQRHVSVSWKCQRRQSALNSLMGDGKSQNSQNNSNVSNSYGLVNNYNSEVSSGTNKDANVKDFKDTSWVKEVKTSVRTPPKSNVCSLGGATSSYSGGRYFGAGGGGGGLKDEYKYSLCPNNDNVDADGIFIESGQRVCHPAAPSSSSSSRAVDNCLRRMGDAQVTLHEEPYAYTPNPKQNVNRSSHAGRCNHAECSNHPLNKRSLSFAQNNPKLPVDNEYGIISDEESSVWKKMSSQTDDITLSSSKTLPTSPMNHQKIGSVDGYYSVERPIHSPQREMAEKQTKESFQIPSSINLQLDDKRKYNTEINQQLHINPINSPHNSASSKHGKRRKHIHCCSANSSPVDHNNYEFISTDQNRHKKRNNGKASSPEIQYVLAMPEEVESRSSRNKMDIVEDEKMSQILKCAPSQPDTDAGKIFPDEISNKIVIGENQNRDEFDNNNPMVANARESTSETPSHGTVNPDTPTIGCTKYKQTNTSNSRHKHRKDKSDNSTTVTKHSKLHGTQIKPSQDRNSTETPVLTREFLHHHKTVDKSVHLRYFQQSIEGHDFLCKSNSLVELTQSQLDDTRAGKFQSPGNTMAATKRGSLSSPSHQDGYYAMLSGDADDNLAQSYHRLKQHQQQQHQQQQQQQNINYKHYQQCHSEDYRGNYPIEKEDAQHHHTTHHQHNHHHHHHNHHHNPYCNTCSTSNPYRQSSSIGEVSDACRSRCDSMEIENCSGEQTSESLEEDFYNNSNATPDLMDGFRFRNVSSSDWKRAKQEEVGGLLADSDTTDEYDGKNDSLSSTRHSADKESGFHSQI